MVGLPVRLLDRYLGLAILTGVGLMVLLLTSIHTLIDFVDELNNAAERGLTFLHAVVLTGLTIPRRVYELFPTAVLLGGLLGLGNLAANNELMVLRASGVSIFRISVTVLKVGLVLSMLAFVMGEFLVPATEHQVEDLKNISKSGRISTGGRWGMWAKDGNRLVNVGYVYPNLRLERIRVCELEGGVRLSRAIYADSAVYTKDHWVLKGVRTTTIEPERVTAVYHEEERWDRLLPTDLFEVLQIEPHKMSARKLLTYIGYLDENGLESNEYKLAFWGHFTVPISATLMLLLAVPFVFGPMRSTKAGQRLFVGLLVGIAFYLVNQAVNNMGLVYGMSPLLVAVLPLAVLLGVILLAMRRVA